MNSTRTPAVPAPRLVRTVPTSAAAITVAQIVDEVTAPASWTRPVRPAPQSGISVSVIEKTSIDTDGRMVEIAITSSPVTGPSSFERWPLSPA